MRVVAILMGASVLLSACNSVAPAPPAPSPGSLAVTPQGFKLPEGNGCAGEIARYRAIQDNDLAMGHVAQSVYDQIHGEIAAAQKVCDAGDDAKARSMIVASRQRHGYPTQL